MMQVSQYTFQTPYPNQLQVGRPDAATQQQEQQQAKSQSVEQNSNASLQEAQQYVAKTQNGVKEKLQNTVVPDVSSVVDSFSALNTKVQASEAYGA
jgi:flagellar biosynthesis/type III secretory pathway protein FliH